MNRRLKQRLRFKRKRFRRKVYSALLLLLAVLLVFDLIFETIGLPEFAKAWFLNSLCKDGRVMTAKKVYFGLFNGLRITGMHFSADSEGITLGAASLRVDTDWRILIPGNGIPLFVTMDDGFFRLKLRQSPQDKELLPELHADEIHFDLATEEGIRKIRSFEAKVNGNTIALTGTADHIFHVVLADFFDSLKNSVAGYRRKKNLPTPLVLDPGFQKILRELLLKHQVFRKNSSAPLLCRGKIHADISDFDRCSGEFDLIVPSFTAGGTRFESIHEHAVLKNGNLYLGKMDILFARDSTLVLAGEYNGENAVFSGTVTGKCRAEDLMHLLGDSAKILRKNHVVLRNDFALIEGKTSRFDPGEGNITGDLTIRLPELVFRNITLKNIQLSLYAEQNIVRGELRHAEPGSGGNITGTFSVGEKGFSLKIRGNAKPQEILNLLEKETADKVRHELSFSGECKNISFAGEFKCSSSGKLLSGTLDTVAESITVRGISTEWITARTVFAENQLTVEDLAVTFRDGTLLTGEVSWQNEKKELAIELICRGSPRDFIRSLYSPLKEQILEYTADVTWPEKHRSTEVCLELHAGFSGNPFMRLSGTLAMKDFAFRKIPFRFGSVHFILGENNTLLLPSATLQSDKGELQLKAAWPGTEKQTLSDTFDFSLVSSLPGNQLISIFYPEWDPDNTISFPYPVSMNAEGSINYKDPEKIRILGNISNAACLWRGILIEDMDFLMNCTGTRLSLIGGKGDICGGQIQADYNYDIMKEEGFLNIALSRIDLAKLFNSLHIGNLLRKRRGKGELSGRAEVGFRYSKNDDLLLFGSTKTEISGEELWRCPVLGTFLNQIHNLWPVVNSGSVRNIHAEGTFMKDVFRLDSLNSDGNVVAVNASGEFRWLTTDYNIRFRAELLKGALPFDIASRLLTPVTWITTKEYKGRYSDFMEKNSGPSGK